MKTPEAVLAALAVGQHGIALRLQALGAGVSRHAIDLRLTDNRLRKMHEGVFLHAAVPLTWKGRLMAAVLGAGEGSAASHRSSARLEGFRNVPVYRPEITASTRDLPL